MKRMLSVLVGLVVSVATHAESAYFGITGFQSKERITHLAPGGANAAREIDVSVQLFDEVGRAIPAAGVPVELVARDAGKDDGIVVGRLQGVTTSAGAFAGRMTLTDCRSPNINGPLSVHRTSNRPEYWDVTYARAGLFAPKTPKEHAALASFIHVCKEVYRGALP